MLNLSADLQVKTPIKKKFLVLYSNIAAPNMNGRLPLTGLHQNAPASLKYQPFP